MRRLRYKFTECAQERDALVLAFLRVKLHAED
jgi:hypothetical protein